MTDKINTAINYAHNNKEQFLSELIEFCKLPSISTDPDHKDDMVKTAEWVANKLKSIGIENVKIMETALHPIVYGDYLHAGDDAPVVAVYGHYDVQPVDPLELWETPPFEPTLKDGKLYARGASDMKSQILAGIFAIQSILENNDLPVNIKFLIEGEEEIGSPSLDAFIKENTELLACDFALNADNAMMAPDQPIIPYALRGLAYYEINVEGPAIDLHSGIFGGTVLNPAFELARLIAGMIDLDGRITLPGFYDSVVEMDAEEREELARLPLGDDFFLENTGAPVLFGEKGYTPVELTGGRPTLDVNGFLSGFTGEGSKTVLPSKAMAKLSMRLVPNQDPKEVEKQLIQYLEENARPGIKWSIKCHASSPPIITPRNSEQIEAMKKALQTVWNTDPLYFRVGGSIPVVNKMDKMLGAPSVLTGFALPDDNIHAPNEKFTIEPWYKGIDALIHFLYTV